MWFKNYQLHPTCASTLPCNVARDKSVKQQIHLVDERCILKIHKNTTNYSYTVDVLVSARDRNVNSVRMSGCVLINF